MRTQRDVVVTEDENGAPVVELRAERLAVSRSGRVYRLTVTAHDVAGNEVTGTATCSVPHDSGKGKQRGTLDTPLRESG